MDCTSSLTIPPCGVLFGHPKHLVIAVPHLEDLPGVVPVQASHPPPVLQQPWRTVRGPTPQGIPPVPLRSTVPSFSSPGGRVSSPFGLAVWKPMGTSSVLGSPRPSTTLAPEGGEPWGPPHKPIGWRRCRSCPTAFERSNPSVPGTCGVETRHMGTPWW